MSEKNTAREPKTTLRSHGAIAAPFVNAWGAYRVVTIPSGIPDGDPVHLCPEDLREWAVYLVKVADYLDALEKKE